MPVVHASPHPGARRIRAFHHSTSSKVSHAHCTAPGRRPGRSRLAPRRLAGADRPSDRLFTAGYWTDLVLEAERGLLDFVTFEDSFGLQTSGFQGQDDRTDQVRGRLDAVLIAARVAPVTRHIGLVPTALVTHTEPFHISKAIATLDYVSRGRAGVRVQISGRVGGGRPLRPSGRSRRSRPPTSATPDVAQLVSDLFDEATDYVEVVRRLWDSWEDGAEIRDARHRAVHRPGQDPLHRLHTAGTSR